MGKVSSWVAPLLLTLGSVVVSLALLEAGVRLYEREENGKSVRTDRPRSYYLPSDAHSTRDFDYSYYKPEGAYRVFVVGDSFTFGVQIEFDDTFAKRLERILNLNKGPLKAEVLNYGIPGFSSAQESQLVRRAVRRQADMVLMEVTLNDAELKPFRVTNPWFDGRGNPKLTAPIFTQWKSLGFVARRLLATSANRAFIKYHEDLFSKPDNWDGFTGAWKQIKQECAEHHVKLVAVIFPMLSHSLDEKYPFKDIHAKIGELLKSLDIEYLDLFDAFAGMTTARLQVVPGADDHPNEIAHGIAAEAIYQWLDDKDIVPAQFQGVKMAAERRGDPLSLLRFDRHEPGADAAEGDSSSKSEGDAAK